MRPNLYRPHALRLLAEGSLHRTLRHYRELEQTLAGSSLPSVRRTHADIRDAIRVIEAELQRRAAATPQPSGLGLN